MAKKGNLNANHFYYEVRYLAKILIVFCSRYGSTGEIVLKIAETIRKSGNVNNIRNLKNLDKQDIPELKQYDGIIIGTGIKWGHWTKEINKFLTDYGAVLKTLNIPIAIFATSGKAINQENYRIIKKMYIDDKIKNKKYNVILTEIFAGVLNLTPNSRFNWFERKIILAMRSEVPQIQPRMKNDFRDWSKIVKFTRKFISKLEESNIELPA